jgi:TIR domain
MVKNYGHTLPKAQDLEAFDDESISKRLHADLQANGVRCWFAPHNLKPGDFFRQEIDKAIHLQDKLLLILSEHSIQSNWVEIRSEPRH